MTSRIEQEQPMTHPNLKSIPVSHGTHNGIPWAIMKNPELGFRCGYVQLPEAHPWRAGDTDILDHIDAHGGITYGPDKHGWIGFDTGHYCDYWPGTYFAQFGPEPHSIVWTAERMEQETIHLAELAAEE